MKDGFDKVIVYGIPLCKRPEIHSVLMNGESEEDALAKAIEYYEKHAESYRQTLSEPEVYAGQHNFTRAELGRVEEALQTLRVMDFEQFLAEERRFMLSLPVTEESYEDYDEALCVLPPFQYVEIDGFVVFCMSEFLTGSYTTQHAYEKATGKAYCATVDAYDKSTWIPQRLAAERYAAN